MFMPSISTDNIANIINKLNLNKQSGFDDIRTKDLYLIKNKISPLIAKLCNLSFKTGVVPFKLKISVVRPIYKK